MGLQRRVLLSSAREMLGNEEARPAYSHGFLFAIDYNIDINSWLLIEVIHVVSMRSRQERRCLCKQDRTLVGP